MAPPRPSRTGHPAQDRRRLTRPRRLAVAVVLAIALSTLIFTFAALQHRASIFAEGQRTTREAARLMEEHASNVLYSHVAVLRAIQRAVRDHGWGNVANEEMHRRLLELMEETDTVASLWLIGANGKPWASTFSYPPPDLDFRDRDYFKAHLDENRDFYVSQSVPNQFGARGRLFNLSMAVRDEAGRMLGIAVAPLRADYFEEFYRSIGYGSGHALGLVRADGEILLRMPMIAGTAGDRLSDDVVAQILTRTSGTFRGSSPFDGVERIYASEKLDELPIFVIFGISVADLRSEWLARLATYSAFAAPALLALSLFGWMAYRRTAALETVNATLEQRVWDRTQDLEKSVRQKDVLLREIHHRVKNNLQVVASLLQLQARQSPGDIDTFVAESMKRLNTMGIVHQTLYQSEDISAVRIDVFLGQICHQLSDTYGGAARQISCHVKTEPLTLDIEYAVPFALIANEVLSNAFKHAFPSGRTGNVWVELRRQDTHILLNIRDDGIGKEPAAAEATGSLGLTLVQLLSRQIGARHEYLPGPGTSFHLALAIR